GGGNTLTGLHAGMAQIVVAQGADGRVNGRAVVERGCAIIPGQSGLTSSMINTFLGQRALPEASQEVAAEM
ncbi:nucleotide disphospho-sugar-binding domain-containing protein, partial [Salmonella enterica]|uniref:nucleotide disphospho-sugar-binding domain-containing protein n=1 Tax=Salmonella enterica TaxID=28901 RepID=UPI003EDC28ED